MSVQTKTRYSDYELKEFETILFAKLQIAKEELQATKGSLDNTNDDKPSTGEATITYDKEMLNSMAVRQQKYVDQLEAALVRIKKKTYGICRDTGKLIPEGRLRAMPHATQCIEAKQKKAA